MTRWLVRLCLAGALLLPATVLAQPAGQVAATCKDGTAFSGATRRGACRGHGGVQSWSDTGDPSTPATTDTTAAPSSPAAAPAPRQPRSSVTEAQSSAGISCPGDKVVWVNTRSHIYHFEGERYFGHTKSGKFMCERAADSEGDRPTHNGQ